MSKLGWRWLLLPLTPEQAAEMERRWRESWGSLTMADYFRLQRYREQQSSQGHNEEKP